MIMHFDCIYSMLEQLNQKELFLVDFFSEGDRGGILDNG